MDSNGNIIPRSVSLARVRLDAGGYDRDGTYWGVDIPLYRAYSYEGDRDYEEYVRAFSRESAAQKLGLTNKDLKRPLCSPVA